MKQRSTVITMALCVALIAAQAPNARAQYSSVNEGKKEVIFACNMNAMTKEQRKRQSQFLTPALHAQRLATSEVADGYEFQFPSDAHTLQVVAEWIGNERLCCPFFRFDIRLGPGPMILKISGPEGVKQFIQAELPGLVS